MSSLPPSGENYIRKISLVDRTIGSPSPVTYVEVPDGVTGTDIENNLDEYFLKIECTNTGNNLTDNMRLTLRIPGDGTFIRSEPILVDENAKFKYLFDFKIEQGVDSSKLFRFEISQAIIQEDEKFGEVLVIVGRGREYILKENLSSRVLRLRTPYDAFNDRVTDFNSNPPNGDGAQPGTIDNNLPGATVEEKTLKQNWTPTGPLPVHRLMEGILDRVALPATSGGVLRDFYMDSEAATTSITFFDMIVDEFGRLPILDSDRVKISPTDFTVAAEQKDKTVITDSVKYKNQVMLRGQATKGSLPMSYVKYASDYEHAQDRPEFDNATAYEVGAIVKRTITAAVSDEQDLVRYFECLVQQSGGPNPLPETDSDWLEDFTIYPEFVPNGTYTKGDIIYDNDVGTINFYQCNTDDASNDAFTPTVTIPTLNGNFSTFPNGQPDTNFTEFVPFSPWTIDPDDWLTNMAQDAPAFYRGMFVDWNIIRTVYDRFNYNNEFERVTMKWVTRQSATPPSGAELFDGQRILVGPGGTSAGWTPLNGAAPIDGENNLVTTVEDRVAQYFKGPYPLDENKIGFWYMSSPPVADDIISNMETTTIRQYTGVHPAGSWTNGWDFSDVGKTSPFHAVKEVFLESSPDGTPNQALRFQFLWKKFTEGGHDVNIQSRGAWINFWYPFPRLAIVAPNKTTVIGEQYGGTSANMGVFDSYNLNQSSDGTRGWNRGLKSEDLGKVTAIGMKLKLDLKSPSGDSINVGVADLPCTFWAVDKFDRTFYFDFTLERVGGWETVIIPFGQRAPKNLYFNRINETIDILGWQPFGNLSIEEKEFTGVTFDWRNVKFWGIQWKYSYSDTGRYKNSPADLAKNFLFFLLQGFVDNAAEINENLLQFDIASSEFSISDLRYIKELYVNSEETNILDARTTLINRESEFDYQTAKFTAQGHRERTKFFPQSIHVRSFGDVRLRLGHRFLLQGDKVPGGEQEMVVQQVKHIIDGTSYKMEIEAKRKFELP